MGWGPLRRGSMTGCSRRITRRDFSKSIFEWSGLRALGLSEHPQAMAAAGALVHYLRETSAIGARKPEDAAVVPSMRPAGTGLEHLDRIAYYEQQDAMILDQVTARNLELVEAVERR